MLMLDDIAHTICIACLLPLHGCVLQELHCAVECHLSVAGCHPHTDYFQIRLDAIVLRADRDRVVNIYFVIVLHEICLRVFRFVLRQLIVYQFLDDVLFRPIETISVEARKALRRVVEAGALAYIAYHTAFTESLYHLYG